MMAEIPMIEMWRGKRIDDECSREELIECIKYLGQKYAEFTAPGMSRAYAVGKVEMMKRGEA